MYRIGSVLIRGAAAVAITALTLSAALAAGPAPAHAQLNPGDIVVADRNANPAGPIGDGAIFKVDPTTGAVSVLATSAQFDNPFDVALDADGNLTVVDRDADPAGLGGDTGAIFRFAPGQAPAVLATSAQFDDPAGVAIDAQDNLVVADLDADPAGLGSNPGAIFRFAHGQAPAPIATSAHARPSSCSAGSNRNAGRRSNSSTAAAAAPASPRVA